jgi:NTE family protein
MTENNRRRTALVLTGGGARGAYQAGVLRGIAEFWPKKEIPFRVVTGISAGTLNAAILAGSADDYLAGTRRLWDLWATLEYESVFRLRKEVVLYNGMQWLLSFALSLFRTNSFKPLLDTEPLRKLLADNMKFDAIRGHFQSGVLDALALTATDYSRGHSVTFFDGELTHNSWYRHDRIGVRATLGSKHIVASCAIPILFEPVYMHGRFFGDGSIRMSAPLSPAIHLGAERILAISVQRPHDHVRALSELHQHPQSIFPEREPMWGDVLGALYATAFFDSLESDFERLNSINNLVRASHTSLALQDIPALLVQPTADIANIAQMGFEKYPFVFRRLLRALGASEDHNSDFLSYLAFESAFTKPLLELGRKDILARKDEILDFILK